MPYYMLLITSIDNYPPLPVALLVAAAILILISSSTVTVAPPTIA